MSVPVPFRLLCDPASWRTAVRHLRPATLALALKVLAVSTPLAAASFCVSDSAELQNALDIAASNGADDTIRLRTGVYPVPGGGFHYDSTEDRDLTLLGGHILFLGGCARTDKSPFATVLDGGGQERVLYLKVNRGAGGTGSPKLRVEGLKLYRGDGGPADAGVGLLVFVLPDTVFPVVEIVGNAILENDTSGVVGGVSIDVGNSSSVSVIGNLFVHNHGNGSGNALGIAGGAGLDAFVNHNTFVDNFGGNGVVSFLSTEPSAAFWASNNLIWDNGGDYDFFLGVSGTVALVSNNYPRSANVNPTLELDRYAFDPKFVNAASGNYDLKPDSPLAGLGATPPLGGYLTYDILGRSRVAGAYVDLGAYEIQVLTSDGFESGTLAVWSAKRP